MTMSGTSGLFTIKQAASLLGISHWTVGEYVRRKRIPTVRIGTVILVSLDQLGNLRVPLRVLRGGRR